MLFGIYLVENGVLDSDEFFEALKLQVRTRPQIGALAIQQGRLSVSQVFGILKRQCDFPDVSFGKIAVELGYLAPAELDRLVQEQALKVKPLRDILIEGNFLPAGIVQQHEFEYRRAMEHASAGKLEAVRG